MLHLKLLLLIGMWAAGSFRGVQPLPRVLRHAPAAPENQRKTLLTWLKELQTEVQKELQAKDERRQEQLKRLQEEQKRIQADLERSQKNLKELQERLEEQRRSSRR